MQHGDCLIIHIHIYIYMYICMYLKASPLPPAPRMIKKLILVVTFSYIFLVFFVVFKIVQNHVQMGPRGSKKHVWGGSGRFLGGLEGA